MISKKYYLLERQLFVFKKFHIFLGATVADAAARPLHWVYNEKKLKSYIKNKKTIAFFKENRCPFYSIKTGEVSGYNAVGQVMFATLTNTKYKNNIIALKEVAQYRFFIYKLNVEQMLLITSRTNISMEYRVVNIHFTIEFYLNARKV